MTRRVAVWLAASVLASGAFAQAVGLPVGRWWERPQVAEKLGLSTEQQQKLEAVTIEHAKSMIDMKAAVQKAEIDLRSAADVVPFDAKTVRQLFAALQQARTKLETERFDLLVRQREIITQEQWKTLRALLRVRQELLQEEGKPARPGDAPWRTPKRNRN
jgi:Spy/CpxP family protein refolding chaperone